MRKKPIRLLLVLVLLLGLGCNEKKQTGQTIVLNPTRDARSPTGVYIPENLEDCFRELERMLPSDAIEAFKEQESVIQYHLTLGRWIRNNWGLWQGSRLADYFNQRHIRHPDDMSTIILDSFWKYLNGRPINLEGQMDIFRKYWDGTRGPKPEVRSGGI